MTEESIELELVLEAIQRTCGYDFRQYARPTLQRRLTDMQKRSNFLTLAELIPPILHDEQFLDQVLRNLSITVTEIFRDPNFYRALRNNVVPILRERPNLKIWHAGCATGEEVYSLAILLKEEGLYDRARIYATDFNNQALHIAQEGIYKLRAIKEGTTNYRKSGGRGSFADFYHAEYDSAVLLKNLKERITFSHHNLTTDGAFGQMDLILCRNVMIYFDRELQQRVFTLFTNSLREDGLLCLGSSETLEYSDVRHRFDNVITEEKIYRRKAVAPIFAAVARGGIR